MQESISLSFVGRECPLKFIGHFTVLATVNSGELQIPYPILFSVHRKYMVCFCHRLQCKTIELYQAYISCHANRNGIRNSKFS